MRYAVVYEKTESGWSAYAPDLPGLGVAGTTMEEVQTLIREGIEFHLEGLKEQGLPVPSPTSRADYIEVSLPA
jgi:predicted RNase H-like HicB family nuclease